MVFMAGHSIATKLGVLAIIFGTDPGIAVMLVRGEE
jgi:hypothetical protein